jgi:hypothetical protein
MNRPKSGPSRALCPMSGHARHDDPGSHHQSALAEACEPVPWPCACACFCLFALAVKRAYGTAELHVYAMEHLQKDGTNV